MEKPFSSWGRTFLTQICLFFALFIAFNISGESEKSTLKTTTTKTRASPLDLYFLSVRGGIRPLKQQHHLLKQMEKVAKTYHVKFIINISELGEDDPLMQNGRTHLSSLKVPWYTTNALQGQRKLHFLKHIPLQHGKILDLIVVDTRSLQDYLPKDIPSKNEGEHMSWLSRTLETTESDWRIVVGYDSLLVCEENGDKKGIKLVYESLYKVFTKYGVTAYLSKQACSNLYTRDGSIAHIGNPGPAYKPSSSNGSVNCVRDVRRGFFLHKVGVLEIVSYFINPANEVVLRSTLHQRGKEFM